MNQVRLLNRWTPNFLDCARPLFRLFDPQAHSLLFIQGLIQRSNYAHVGQTFLARRFRLFVPENTIGEVHQFGPELVGLAEVTLPDLAIDRNFQLEAFRILIGRIGAETTLGADDFVRRNVGCPKTARKTGELRIRKAQNRAYAFLDLAETLVLRASIKRKHLLRLRAEQITRCVDAIYADVPKRSAAHCSLQSNVVGLYLHGER